ncbi:CHAD domain-containing protein [Pseudomonas sp. UBA6323]|uniref:CHAD domain-containing protein n=1 Tax=Pseudomonas sp. UBA6323 TaxID=1947329 RepID=UPI0025E786E2|nr:CHAD domain-containing protein [Pseudomonas sp. UBA6323]
MSDFIEHCLGRVLALQMRLYACQARLADCTDPEALHDLRIALRQLRSLLRPLRGLPAVDALEQGAAVLGRLSGPLRDREVLVAELERLGLAHLAPADEAQRAAGYAAIARSGELADLMLLLDSWPSNWRDAARQGQLNDLKKRIRRRLRRQQRQLARALRDPAHDRHRLRLLIKRVRYGAETYPAQSRLDKAARQRLKRAQSALGDWHDHVQWLAQAEASPSLQPCLDAWRRAEQAAERRADEVLLALYVDFPG